MQNFNSGGRHILYIGRKLVSIDGGSVVSKRNIDFLIKISHGKLIDFYSRDKTRWGKLFNTLLGNPWGFSEELLEDLTKVIQNFDICLIFIDHSLLGGFARLLKKYNIPIFVFFHNVELLYYKDKVLIDGFLNNLMVSFAKKNEKSVVRYADRIICLTERDSKSLNAIYGRGADLILPITVEDKYEVSKQIIVRRNYHLFVGSSFFANIEGIEWYIDNVLDFVDMKLLIIGNGMETLIDKYGEHPKIEIKGFVEDLTSYYNCAEFVINPVRLGSGMKAKTIEALMYGKTILGTTEAFVGLSNIEENRIGNICNTPQEFIDSIRNLSSEKLNMFSRNYFLENFSMDIGYTRLNDFFKENFIS